MPARKQPKWRILDKIEMIPEAGCWLWTARIGGNGYGSITTPGGSRKEQAHRVSYKDFIGPIPAGMCVLHKCDVRACVNPNHLWLGTKKDNTADMDAKGRGGRWSKRVT